MPFYSDGIYTSQLQPFSLLLIQKCMYTTGSWLLNNFIHNCQVLHFQKGLIQNSLCASWSLVILTEKSQTKSLHHEHMSDLQENTIKSYSYQGTWCYNNSFPYNTAFILTSLAHAWTMKYLKFYVMHSFCKDRITAHIGHLPVRQQCIVAAHVAFWSKPYQLSFINKTWHKHYCLKCC